MNFRTAIYKPASANKPIKKENPNSGCIPDKTPIFVIKLETKLSMLKEYFILSMTSSVMSLRTIIDLLEK